MTEPKEYIQLSASTFSGKFPLPLAFPSLKKVRHVIISTDVIRKPTTEYMSKKTNPDESFYGTMMLCRDGYVQSRLDLKYESQTFELGDKNATNLYFLIHCTFNTIISGLINISADVGGGLERGETPEFFQPIQFLPDIIKFTCYADTLLKVVVRYVEFDVCTNQEPEAKVPPPPPKPDTKYPSGSPVGAVDGYSPKPFNTSPGDYKPFPTDNDGNEGGESGDSCQPLIVVTSYEVSSDGGNNWNTISSPINVFGKVGDISIGTRPNGNADVVLECQGIIDFQQVCGELEPRGITALDSPDFSFRNAEIISIT